VSSAEELIPPHGGYRKLKSFQVAQLAYDVTVRFCDRFVERRSRTHDQMVQAARSGVQNIAEGSQASGTSRKMELKLTNVARASLEELRLDYEDYLRQRGLLLYPPDHPALMRFKARRCSTLDEVRIWVEEEARATRNDTDPQGLKTEQAPSVPVRRRAPTSWRPMPRFPCSTWHVIFSTVSWPIRPRHSRRRAGSPSGCTACVNRNAGGREHKT